MLEHNGQENIAGMLSDSKCTIIDTGKWAKRHGGTLWDGNATTINFAVPVGKYSEVVDNIKENEKDIIKNMGNRLIQPNVTGLEITEVTFSILLKESLEGEVYKPSAIKYDEQTENARILLYALENKLRDFVSSKIKEYKGNINTSILKDWKSSKRKEFMPPRQPFECDLINYSSFDQLKKIIVQNENWEKIFKTYFGRQDGVISRLNELDEIRDTIAHNRIISTFDFNSFKTLYYQILGCIEKQK